MTAKEWGHAIGGKFLKERDRFRELVVAIKALAPSVPSLVLGEESDDALAFTFAGTPCRLRFLFGEHPEAAGSLIYLEIVEERRFAPGGFSVHFDAAGRIGNIGPDELVIPRDAEEVFYRLLKAPR